ncbi:MAG: Fe(2+) transport system protein B [Chlorobi bacterium OLB4]|nr:MAG: Fe(2+) transport system protein B [Chlorobi bacterium OLB4]MBW7856264.1 ferrous iron transport protein B [Ignavibacteria bacterium]OQY78863.1 MAG: ferrous iron transport protein B [Ignavibacteriales bacterium UTCHB1]
MNYTETENKIPLIAIAGQPNSGKTTLFNLLSGRNSKTVNYPGSTVEYSVAPLLPKFSLKAKVIDSPGIISLVPSSIDEKISIDTLYSHPELGKPDVIIVTVDASQLSRHLFIALQLIESKFKIVVVLTMTDLLLKKNFNISAKKLSETLKCDVVKLDNRTGNGVNEIVKSVNKILVSSHNVSEVHFHSHPSFDKDDLLLNSYDAIGQIEKDVLYKVQSQLSETELLKANEKLVVLNSEPAFLKPDELTLKLDRIFLHKFWGLIIFFIVMFILFSSIFYVAAPIMDLVSEGISLLSGYTVTLLGDTWYGNLISQGVINGVGSVLVFLPQILILFLLLGLFEDSGYLARGAMLIDKPLSLIGLNGRSFVPMLSGFACAIPAIMATRTIPNRRERLLTIFIIPLMSCSARLPVYALLIAFLIPADKPVLGGLVLTFIYVISVFSSVLIASIIHKIVSKYSRRKDSSFILELPAYRKPKLSNVIRNSYRNARHYIVKAGPVILMLSLLIWVLTYFPNTEPQVDETGKTADEIILLKNSERVATSFAADLGKMIEPVMKPLGLDWRVGVSLIAAFAAREVFVSSLALIFKVTDDGDLQNSILSSMRNATFRDSDQKVFTISSTAGLIVFFVFALQCISTLAISRKETGSWKVPMVQLFVFTLLAYIAALITVTGFRFFGMA